MLWKKMFRDILSNIGSYIAVLVIVIIGLTAFTAFSIVSDNLKLTKETFYQEQNFAHGFVELVSMPEHEVEQLSQIEGIREVNGRIVRDVRVNDPDRDESIYLRLVSLNLADDKRINDVKLLEGEELVKGELAAWIDSQYFAVNNLEMNQEIQIIAEGRARNISIYGYGMSPEFTYTLRTQAEIYPNPEQFGIAFLPLEDMGTLFSDMSGRVNNLIFTLEKEGDYHSIKEKLESELEQYGVKSIYPRDDQISHLILSEELAQLERMSTAFPLLFLFIAGIIIYIMLKRLIEQQRVQIGILKSLGYSNKEVITHYLSYALIIGLIGGFIGGILGIFLATPLTRLLLEFFNVPEFYEGFSMYYLVIGILLSLTVFLISGYQGCRQALKLKPAEAMTPPVPLYGKKIFLEKITYIWEMFTVQGKMALRNLMRNRGRNIFMFIGITLSCAVIALTWSLVDMADKLVFYQYEEVEVYDAKITLTEPSARVPIERELLKYPEVIKAEPLAEIPAKLSNRWLEEDVLVLGIIKGSNLYNVLDSEGERVELSNTGLVLSERLADKLDVSVGSALTFKTPFLPEEDARKIEVQEIIPQYLGMNAYMKLSGLEKVLGGGKIATSYLLNVDDENIIPILRDHYQESDFVAGVDGRDDRVGQMEELMETYGGLIYLYALVGVIIGFAIIYSSSFIILSERSHELASMKVLGMTSEEVFSVITFEQWAVSFIAILFSFPLALLMQFAIAEELSTDMYSIPKELSNDSLIAAVVISVFSIWIAQRFALRRVRNLSLVEVLKSRE